MVNGFSLLVPFNIHDAPSSSSFLRGPKLVFRTHSLVDPYQSPTNTLDRSFLYCFSKWFLYRCFIISIHYSNFGKLSEIAIFATVSSTICCAGSWILYFVWYLCLSYLYCCLTNLLRCQQGSFDTRILPAIFGEWKVIIKWSVGSTIDGSGRWILCLFVWGWLMIEQKER